MELRVKHTADISNCFASLPLSLIQTLQSTSTNLPQLLTLQLRSVAPDPDPNSWFLAWSGATSSSDDIEVAKQFAECISLPDNIMVQVRVVSNVPKATLVTVEPHTEDDWEVLELNSEHAEEAILSQVRIVHESMRFPLWLHGHNIITFSVLSTFPKKGVVQLVPGSEIAVAPKRREKNVGSYNMQSSNEEHHTVKALLRLQDPDTRFICSSISRGIELGIGLTTIAFVNPQTARGVALESSQLVLLMPKFSPKDKRKNSEGNSPTAKSNSVTNDIKKGVMKDKSRHVIVRILHSESVARGHVMIAESLCHFLRAGVHSWVYLKECNITPNKNIPSVIISPCHFIMPVEDVGLEKNIVEALDGQRSTKTENITAKASSYSYMDIKDLLIQYNNTSFSDETCEENKEVAYRPEYRKGLQPLLQAWCLAQLEAIASNTKSNSHSLILGSETLLHFEIKDLGYKFRICEKAHGLSDDYLESQKARRQSPHKILCLLKISEESQQGCKINAYDITCDDKIQRNEVWQDFKLFEKLDLGDPVTYHTSRARYDDKGFGLDISSLGWMGTTASDVVKRMMVLLSPTSGTWFSTFNLPLPGHVIIYGTPGSGKTLLARAVARSLEEHKDILAHTVLVCCSKLALEKGPAIRQALCAYISEALDNAPSVMIFDDLDSIISSSSDLEVSQPSTSAVALTEFLTDIMDEYGVKRMSSCGIGPIAFIATVQALDKMPESLRSSGRFDYHVQLPAPAAAERQAILKYEIEKRSLKCSDEIFLDISSKCDGYDAYDLEILVDRTIHASIGRFLSSSSCKGHEKPTLFKNDFSLAMQEFVPVAMRDITKSAPEGGSSGWDDVGGLNDIQNAIKEMIELPSKFPNIFVQAPLRLRSNVLLYGPPGCGKTHIVGAAATACSLRFISVKGPELLNKYIGASEQAVRDIFSKAAAAAPCLLFFDEFDSIAPKRGHDNTGVTDRVVNQFLTELDGIEVLTGVFVFAATSRPDLLDAALLRPGRLDRLLFCDFPSRSERLDILKVLSRKLPLANDVDLDAVAYMAEGFSGADLQALLSDAQLAAVHALLDVEHDGKSIRKPVITNTLLNSIALNARPSVSDTEKTRLYDIYSQFLNAKRSASAQSRDAKVKRATLA